MNGPSHPWKGSWMISRSANSSSRKGSTWVRSAGPPRFSITIPVFTRLMREVYSSGSDESRFQREPGESGHRAHAQLAHQAFPVGFHGAMADAELERDLAVGPPLGDADQNLSLAGGELGEGRRPRLARLSPADRAETGGDRGTEEGLSPAHGPDGAPQFGRGRVLEQIAVCARPKALHDVLGVVVHAENQDVGPRRESPELRGHPQPRASRHRE